MLTLLDTLEKRADEPADDDFSHTTFNNSYTTNFLHGKRQPSEAGAGAANNLGGDHNDGGDEYRSDDWWRLPRKQDLRSWKDISRELKPQPVEKKLLLRGIG